MRVNRNEYSLGRVPLFEGVPSNELSEIEQRCNWRHFNAGEEIVAYLDQSDEVYFVVSGKAKVIIYSTQGRAVGFRDLVPGDVFGEYAAIDGNQRSASIEADIDCVMATMASNDFRHITTHNPTVARTLALHFTRQLRALTQRVYEFTTLAVDNRIQAELLRLARESTNEAANSNEPAHITPAPTHAAIAARISTHREAVSRQLSRLTKSGLIERKGRSLIVKDVKRLEQLVRNATGE